MQTIELLPEPGIKKKFDLVIPSDVNRRVKVYSSEEGVNFSNNNQWNLLKSVYNKINGEFLVLKEDISKIILRVIDQDSNKIIHSFIIKSQPKKIIPLKTLSEEIKKGEKRIINLSYFNKKSIAT